MDSNAACCHCSNSKKLAEISGQILLCISLCDQRYLPFILFPTHMHTDVIETQSMGGDSGGEVLKVAINRQGAHKHTAEQQNSSVSWAALIAQKQKWGIMC